jgi:hypothetical protein
MTVIDRRRFLAAGAALGCGAAFGSKGTLAQMVDDQELAAAELINRETQDAIDRGLAYLVSRQRDDGSFESSGYGRNVAVCALAGMAFMSSGSMPGRGPYGEQVSKCIRYLLDHAQDNGFIVDPDGASHGPMYGHGFATLFLAEVYGMTPDSSVRDALEAAVNVIIASQNEDGGWRYKVDSTDADISVTICEIMALRAARNAGIMVPSETVDRCIDYVKRSQNADGGFMYMVHGGPSAFPRSAAGVVALYSAGIYEGEEIERGIEYLRQFTPRRHNAPRESHFFYGQYYAVQAMWHAGGENWRRWYPAARDTLVGMQLDNGSWSDSICYEYGTAMACLVLQMPNNYLPIFQR